MRKNVLSIESAVADGSIALICHGPAGSVLKFADAGSSRMEKIIPIIVNALHEADLTIADLDMIAVSTGPGSYSGIRIGLSTALGLANSLNIPCVGVSVLEAMAYDAGPVQKLIAAVPVGKNDVAWQPFEFMPEEELQALCPPELLSTVCFTREVEKFPNFSLAAEPDLLTRLAEQLPDATPRMAVGATLAELIGRFALLARTPSSSLKPIYLRNRDAEIRSAHI